MALTIDWPTKVINVPRADMLLIQSVPSEIRQLDLDAFRLELKEIEGSEEGQPFLDTHSHNTTVTVGGVTLARVIEIINGYTVTFEDGQYAVNLVGANSNVADVTNVNQVSVRSANSAGLTYSDAINKQSFLGGFVYIHPDDGLAGTAFPRGTPSDPVNNFEDALIIAEANNFGSFNLDGALTLTGDSVDHHWEGHGAIHTDLALNNVDVSGSSFAFLRLSGTGNGRVSVRECLLGDITEFNGIIKESQLGGTLIVGSGVTDRQSFVSCSSSVPGDNTPILDFNGSVCDGEFRYYAGGIEIRNFNAGNDMSIDMVAGHVKIADSCTSGYILIRGNCKVTDNTTGAGITINTDHVVNSQVESVKRDSALIPATL